MAAVGLEHHRATSGECRSGIATGCGKRQREITGAKHGHRADANAHLPHIRARQRLARGQGQVYTSTMEIATPQYLGK
ncbi:hypothetical protein D3C76_1407960 [compost metagenome]